MNMGAYFLSCFGGAKHPDDRDPRHGLLLFRAMNTGKVGIESSRSSLIMVDAIQSDPKDVHRIFRVVELIEQHESKRMMG